MKPASRLFLASLCVFVFNSCANRNTAGYDDPIGTGPFDSQGNYREDWADDPTKWRKPGSRKPVQDDLPVIAANERPPAHSSPLPQSSSRPAARTSTSTASAAPKPKPKTVAAKPKPKPKPTPTRYVVRKGDNLWTIANRNKTTVAAIQKANRISGSMIRPGQSLVIPKR